VGGAPVEVFSTGGDQLGTPPACSKSIDEYARSFDSRCQLSICRIVPDLERMTRDCVVAPPER